MHFPPVSDSPYFRRNFQTSKNFPNFTFSEINFRFSSANFFCHRLQICNFPYFRCFSTFPPISEKFVFPYFCKFPPDFINLRAFTYFTCFSFLPTLTMMHLCMYASHNARTGRPCIKILPKIELMIISIIILIDYSMAWA